MRKKQDKQIRVVEMAAQIIYDIRSTFYNLKNYKIPDFQEDNFFDNVPISFKKFLMLSNCTKK